MTVYERIKKLCKKNGVTIAQMERDLNLSRGATYKWKSSEPNMETLRCLSQYFQVPIEQITEASNTKPQSIDLNDEINRLLYALTGEQSAYFSGDLVSEEGKLALINSLKQDLEFLKATTKK